MGKITGIYSCPSCSLSITFRNETTRLTICSCGAVIHRLESDDLVIKIIPVITGSNDLLQPGASGKFEGHGFDVLGRFRLWLDESVFNYWTILFDDGTIALLAEAYGLYAILRRISLDKYVTPDDLNSLAPSQPIDLLAPDSYFLKNKDLCCKYEVQGEVFMPECTDTFPLFDLYSPGGKHIEIIEFLPRYLVPFSMQYVSFDALKLTGLNTNPPEQTGIVCPHCKNEFAVKTYPYAQSCSCPSCGARIAFSEKTGAFRYVSTDKINKDDLSLPLGATGTLKGISYEVIGYAWKEDNSELHARWKEYVLYNRAEGYAFLSEYAGNWIYAREKGDSPVMTSDEPFVLDYKGTVFQLYNRYKITIVDTAGEFPYNVYDDAKTVSAEFIAPPFMWIYEKSREEGINLFLGEYVHRNQLIEQFHADLPPKLEKGILEPRGFMNPTRLAIATLIAIAVLIIVHFGIGAIQQDRTILENDIEFRDSATTATYVSSKFNLTKWRSNLEFDISAPVDNNWADLDIYLVNSVNGTEQSVEQLVQYYHGYEDGEGWSEGSNLERTYMSGIPAGNYFLRVEATKDGAAVGWNGPNSISLIVRNDVPMHRNFFIFLFLLLLWPVITYFRSRAIDKKRWLGSPFSPYKT